MGASPEGHSPPLAPLLRGNLPPTRIVPNGVSRRGRMAEFPATARMDTAKTCMAFQIFTGRRSITYCLCCQTIENRPKRRACKGCCSGNTMCIKRTYSPGPRFCAGRVTSAIEEASGRTMCWMAPWLAVITGWQIKGRAGMTHRWRSGAWAASSPEHLAFSLGQATLREPDRFGRVVCGCRLGQTGATTAPSWIILRSRIHPRISVSRTKRSGICPALTCLSR